ncbi:MAG TPA: prepilin-type N-terminal cleavage/methylation domain-containing protein [Candidatus Methylacidiphilales bacterium]|jgi:uncharacterized protein (TIGR02599 family)|nr:prepilin-type N-terminal cleavage/methylation domain-containing protein [Candidatus Methylacidiphilales bacterium]
MPLSFPPAQRTRRHRRSFTLLEVLVTLAILLAILVALAQAMDSADRAVKSGASDPFAPAQDAFETVAGRLADATLETYEDYADASGNFSTNATLFVADHLARRSDLAFACGPATGASGLLAASQRTTAGSAIFFTAPEGATQTYANQGLGHLLNDLGYFVEFGDDNSEPAFLLTAHRYRWRLRQVQQPSEALQVYSVPGTSAWIQQLVPAGAAIPMLAENVIALVVLPERYAADTGAALAPAYSYDSRNAANAVTLNQLPPRLILALVAIDELSAERLAAQNGTNAPPLVPANLFQQGTPTQLTQDLATLDASLTAQKIGHRIFQREIQLPSAAWSNGGTP